MPVSGMEEILSVRRKIYDLWYFSLVIISQTTTHSTIRSHIGRVCYHRKSKSPIRALLSSRERNKIFPNLFDPLYSPYLPLARRKALYDPYLPLAIRRTLITRMMVGLIGMTLVFISSRTMPTIDSKTIRISNWFHLKENGNYWFHPK